MPVDGMPTSQKRPSLRSVQKSPCENMKADKIHQDIRLRPATPEKHPHVHKDRVLYHQRDQEDNQTLSAEGDYNSVSSMIFTAPGK